MSQEELFSSPLAGDSDTVSELKLSDVLEMAPLAPMPSQSSTVDPGMYF